MEALATAAHGHRPAADAPSTAVPAVPEARSRPRVVALIPAYNEAGSIALTIAGILFQERVPDLVVVIPNGCTDNTAAIARSFPVTVLELPRLEHRKSAALNRAWSLYARDADVVICLDADTVLPYNAVADWVAELTGDRWLGGSSSKFTMLAPGLLSKLQKVEFATWTQTALNRGRTNVLAGTGCAISGEALRVVGDRPDREGPWSYESATEDFELTYRIRELGYVCQVSPTVRAYTDSMRTLSSLWSQRMKWQVGTVEDLLSFGVNALTARDWAQQLLGLLNAFSRSLWVCVVLGSVLLDVLALSWIWCALPLLFVGLDVKRAGRVPFKDRTDTLIAWTFVPNEFFQWMRGAWFIASWLHVATKKITNKNTDMWAAQYAAEGV